MMEDLRSDYELRSYKVQRDVCQLRRDYNLPCRKCKFLNKCLDDYRILERLNNDLRNTKPRYPK